MARPLILLPSYNRSTSRLVIICLYRLLDTSVMLIRSSKSWSSNWGSSYGSSSPRTVFLRVSTTNWSHERLAPSRSLNVSIQMHIVFVCLLIFELRMCLMSSIFLLIMVITMIQICGRIFPTRGDLMQRNLGTPITTPFPIRTVIFYLYVKFTYFYLKCFYLSNRKSRNPVRIVTFWALYKRGIQPLVGYDLTNKVIEFDFKELSSTAKSIHALCYNYLQTQVIDLEF